MEFPLSRSVAPGLTVLASTPSTNDALAELDAAGDAPDLTVVATMDQTAGRGRLGRVWVAPAGEALAVSVLLRPTLPAGEPLALQHYGWFPLLAGVAMARAVRSVLPERPVALKWPNDVLVEQRKVCGILAELRPAGDAVVLGAGLNLTIPAERLPTPVSTSLALEGAVGRRDGLVDAVLSEYLRGFVGLYRDLLRFGADADASGAREAVVEECGTLGREVRVLLQGADDLVGTATSIDGSGRLMVVRSSDGATVPVAAGDVTHLR